MKFGQLIEHNKRNIFQERKDKKIIRKMRQGN